MEDAVALAQKTLKEAFGDSGKPIEQYGIEDELRYQDIYEGALSSAT